MCFDVLLSLTDSRVLNKSKDYTNWKKYNWYNLFNSMRLIEIIDFRINQFY